jgi:hypothetical protein
MWTSEDRARNDRSKLRHPSDLTDAEWAQAKPLIPAARRGGNRRHWDERDLVVGLMYILNTGFQWRAIPKDCRLALHLMSISICGDTTARSSASTQRFM